MKDWTILVLEVSQVCRSGLKGFGSTTLRLFLRGRAESEERLSRDHEARDRRLVVLWAHVLQSL